MAGTRTKKEEQRKGNKGLSFGKDKGEGWGTCLTKRKRADDSPLRIFRIYTYQLPPPSVLFSKKGPTNEINM